MVQPLEFESKILVDTFSEDCLFVYARGLGVDRLFLHHLKLYSHPKVLVLVLNTRPQDEDYFVSKMKKERGTDDVDPIVVTNEVSVAESLLFRKREALIASLAGGLEVSGLAIARPPTSPPLNWRSKPLTCSIVDLNLRNDLKQACYLRGGVQFVTTRILVVDFLMNRVPAELVTGILVYRAETILDSFQESFILRMFREKKPKGGFVKAFSDFPTFFGLQDIGQLQRLVSKLFVRKVVFMPRFEADVKMCLEKCQPEVIELGVDLSSSMKKIQIAMMEIIAACTKELKQCNPGVLVEESDNSSTKGDMFSALKDTALESKLELEVSHLSEKSRRLLSELRTLRVLLHQMEQLDPVSFYHSIEILKNNEKTFLSNSGWIFTTAAHRMFSEAEKRVSIKDQKDKESRIEPPPKWKALQSVLKEIQDAYVDFKGKHGSVGERGSVLIVAANMPCCKQLADLIMHGEEKFLKIPEKNFKSTAAKEEHNGEIGDEDSDAWWWKKDCVRLPAGKSQEAEERGGTVEDRVKRKKKGKRKAEGGGGRQLTLTEMIPGSSNNSKRRKEQEKLQIIDLDSDEDVNRGFPAEDKPSTSSETSSDSGWPILTFFSLENRRYDLMKTLDEVGPMFVVLYHANLETIRQIEIYKATRGVDILRVYFVLYNKSVEEQEYLSSLQREKLAFQHLIQESSSLLIPREFDVSRDQPMVSSSTRRAGGQREQADEPAKPQIVVDMREFRSELPSIIYKRGMEVVPLTMEVGDYILTPDTCVERKSVADLVGSLQNGRLYTQAQQMLRHYPARSILLIETPSVRGNNPKRWRGGPFAGGMGPGNRELRAKLTVLTRQCPTLRLVWSTSPQATVELFEDLKWQKPEPDPEVIQSIKADELGVAEGSGNFNPTGRKMALKLPGVTEKNVDNLLENCGSFRDICQGKLGKKLKLSDSDLKKISNFCSTDFRKL